MRVSRFISYDFAVSKIAFRHAAFIGIVKQGIDTLIALSLLHVSYSFCCQQYNVSMHLSYVGLRFLYGSH
jgi:hypothetical protein